MAFSKLPPGGSARCLRIVGQRTLLLIIALWGVVYILSRCQCDNTLNPPATMVSRALSPNTGPEPIEVLQMPITKKTTQMPVPTTAQQADFPIKQGLLEKQEQKKSLPPLPEAAPSRSLRDHVVFYTLANKYLSIALKHTTTSEVSALIFANFTNFAAGAAVTTQFKILPELFLLEIQEYPQVINSSQCFIKQLISQDSGFPKTLDVRFICEASIAIVWSISIGENDHFFRASIEFTSSLPKIKPRILTILLCHSENLDTIGVVPGSPMFNFVSNIFAALEHPISSNGVLKHDPKTGACSISDIPKQTASQPSRKYTTVVGVFSRSLYARRAFVSYLEQVRSHKARTFLHYNSWFDFMSWQEPNKTAFQARTMTETSCLDRVESFGTNLVTKRNVRMDSFLWDDGWDDHASLWSFHKGFPRGFTDVRASANKFGIGCGVWVSPWGGYGSAKDARLMQGRAHGYEISAGGFQLSGPRYYKRFWEITMSMVSEYAVNMFKFDGVNFRDGGGYETEVEAMMRLLVQLRKDAEDLFINLTTGTWPSPFWLLYADSIWRGYGDLGLVGLGSNRQQWVSYRDAVVFVMVVRRANMFPIHALMLHGIVVGAVGESRYLGLDKITSIRDFSDEVWSYFGLGVFLQELYISPDLMSEAAWDVVARAAKWARSLADVFVDSHWIGGNPALLDVYGAASWAPRAGVLFLRNPGNITQVVNILLGRILELPSDAPLHVRVWCEYSSTATELHGRLFQNNTAVCAPGAACVLRVDQRYALLLRDFEVIVLMTESVASI